MFSYAQIPLDLSCRRPGLRLVGDQVADKSETRSATFLFVGCPNSIGSILSETRSATFLFVENLSATRSPTFFVVSKFHCFYLAQKSRRRVADLLDLSWHVEIDLSCRRPGPRLFFLLKTCRRPGFKQVLSKIDVMEFGHNWTLAGSFHCLFTSCIEPSRMDVVFSLFSTSIKSCSSLYSF